MYAFTLILPFLIFGNFGQLQIERSYFRAAIKNFRLRHKNDELKVFWGRIN